MGVVANGNSVYSGERESPGYLISVTTALSRGRTTQVAVVTMMWVVANIKVSTLLKNHGTRSEPQLRFSLCFSYPSAPICHCTVIPLYNEHRTRINIYLTEAEDKRNLIQI